MLPRTAMMLLQIIASAPPQDDLLRDARAAQARFESVRRQHVPQEFSSGGGCDTRTSVRIGRFCYWHDATDKPVVPEPRTIIDARARLLAFLDSAVSRAPSDAWIVGQRTRYLIEGDRLEDAVAGARSGMCRAERWWCAALEGLSLHVAQRYAEADSVYGIAIAAMPEERRCQWFTINSSVEGGLAHELDRATCAERIAIVNRLWQVSRPLWSTPGNDLRTEHFARHTMAEILTRSANAHGMAWSSDSEELLLRYGWAEWFTRQRDDATAVYASPRLTGHDREPSYRFLPAVDSQRELSRITEASWNLRDPLALTRYAPRHVKRMNTLQHQLARFPRGDSMFVAVAYRITDTALVRDSSLAWILTGEAGDDRQQIRDRRRGTGDHGVLSGMIASDSAIASIEVVGDRSQHAARARYAVDPLPCRDAWCVSDLLLFDAATVSDSAQLDAVLPTAAPEPRFSHQRPMGVFWEIQGAGEQPVPAWLGLTVSPLRVSLARRLATKLRLAPELAPVRLRWQATLYKNRSGQFVTVRLPANARGPYRVHLTVEPVGAPALSATRDIEVLP